MTKTISMEAIEVERVAKIVAVRKLWEHTIFSYSFFYQVMNKIKKIKRIMILQTRVSLKQSYHGANIPIIWKKSLSHLSGQNLSANLDYGL